MGNNKRLPKDYLVLALDVDTMDEAKTLVKELKDYVGTFKVGLQLYTAVGPDVIKMIKDEGAEIYFDGKFHDIPNTVAKSCANLVKSGVSFFNVHVQGSTKMLSTSIKLSKETAKRYEMPKPVILGVTLLTSFGQRTLTEEIKVNMNIDEYAMFLAKTAKEAGLDGVIATGNNIASLKKVCGKDFIVMCPAIRPTWSVVNDQVRVITPSDAIKSGVDYMVVGRPITSADDRAGAANLILDEIENALDQKDEILFI